MKHPFACVALAGCLIAGIAPAAFCATPEALVPAAPVYPRGLAALGIMANVLLDCAITPLGTVSGCSVVESSDPRFDDASVAAELKARYAPLVESGRLVGTQHHRVNFTYRPAFFTQARLACTVTAAGHSTGCVPTVVSGGMGFVLTLVSLAEKLSFPPGPGRARLVDTVERVIQIDRSDPLTVAPFAGFADHAEVLVACVDKVRQCGETTPVEARALLLAPPGGPASRVFGVAIGLVERS